LGQEALASSADTQLHVLCGNAPSGLTAEMVFAAAGSGDHVAQDVLNRVAQRMARVIGSVSTLVNPELVVLAGGVAASAHALIPVIEEQLPKFTFTPPRVEASSLGDGIVSIGAIRLALDYVEEHALDLYPASFPKPAQPVS
jgi:predicted NBD/HSP70 family sugar kinase